jgi:hypothetical protein
MADPGTTNDQFQKVVDTYSGDVIAPPPNTPVNVTNTQVSNDEIIGQNSGQVGATAPTVNTAQGTAQTVAAPDAVQTSVVDAAKAGTQVEGVLDQFNYAKGTVEDKSTVKGQMTGLMQDFEGGATPVWAAGALRNANDQMAARGLGASSIAGAATTQAAMEAALPIAQQDAQAQLAMQMANLSNEQQMLVQKNDARVTALFSDVASENASRQFNASSENQSRQFNSNLKAQADQFNKNQINAMEQFNAGESNAASLFKAQMEDQREQFNAQNRLVIDQSNATWRRQVTTTNNAEQNEANRLAAQLTSATTLADYNNKAQARRDAINYAFTASENAQTRAVELILATMNRDEARAALSSNERMSKESSKSGLYEAAGAAVAAFLR